MKKKISITIENNILDNIDDIIDHITIRNRSQAIEHLVRNSLGEERSAVILFGGNPKDLKVSKDQYRLTALIKGKPLIEHSINKLRENSFKDILIISRHSILTKIFSMLKDGKDYGVNIRYIEEKRSKGTAESLKLIKGKVTTNFLVIYGDIFFKKINIEALWSEHIKNNSLSTLMLTTSPDPNKKGIVKIEGNKILRFIQKPKMSETYLGFSSIFAAEPEILDFEGKSLEYDIFPELAKRELLNGHLSSEKEIHIHTLSDTKKVI